MNFYKTTCKLTAGAKKSPYKNYKNFYMEISVMHFFSRAGFTDAAVKENETAIYVDLAAMDKDLARGMNASWPVDDLPI